MSLMSNSQYEALDIYTFLFRAAFGTAPEEIDYRVHNGSNGVINKTLNYIKNKYLNAEGDEDGNLSDK